MAALEPGLTGEVAIVVRSEDTAAALASGAVAVLATPRVIGLMEQAAALAVQPTLPHDQTTVGTRVDMRHLAATPVGMQVTARAELIEVAGRVLRFRVTAHDARELVAEGTHERTIVERERFLARVAQKAG